MTVHRPREKLGATVGALVVGVDRDAAARRRRRCPALVPRRARGSTASLVFRGPAPRRRHAGGVQQAARAGSRCSATAIHPEIFRVTLDPAKNPVGRLPAGHVRLAHRRLHRRHPDHGHDAERPRGRRRPGARPSSPARTRPTTTSATTRRSASSRCGSCTPSRPSQRLVNADPSPEELAMWRSRPAEGAPAGVDATDRAAARWCSGPPPSHVVGHGPRRGPGPARRPARAVDRARARLPPRVGGRRHGDLGQPGRAAPGAAATTPTSPRDMHRCTLAGDEADPVTDAATRPTRRAAHRARCRRPTGRRRCATRSPPSGPPIPAIRSRRGTRAGRRASTCSARWPATRRWPGPSTRSTATSCSAPTLSPRQRELLVLRVAAVRRSAYEWTPARRAGRRRRPHRRGGRPHRRGPGAPGWSPLDRAHGRRGRRAARRRQDGRRHLGGAGRRARRRSSCMDLVFTVGAYDLLAMAFRSFGVELDDDLRR